MNDAVLDSSPDSHPHAQPATELHAELHTLRAEVAELRAREQTRSTRRGLLRLAGAAAVAGGTAALAGSESAAAAPGGNMLIGLTNDAAASETRLDSTALNTLHARNPTGTCFKAVSTAGGAGLDVLVASPTITSYAVSSTLTANAGFPFVAGGGHAHMWMVPDVKGPSVSTDHSTGEIAYDSTTFALWVCVAGGNPGLWRKLGGLFTAGQLHVITPSRVYDSRAAVPSPGRLNTGVGRTVSIKDKRNDAGTVTESNVVPADATAIAFNVTAIQTAGAGFLAVNPGGVTTVSAASVNWASAGMVIGNASVVGVDTSRQITVVCGGGAGTSSHFTVDVVGFYR